MALAILLMANLSALIDSVVHPDIPYFDEEHLIVGGISGALTAVLMSLLGVHLKDLRKSEREILSLNEELGHKVKQLMEQKNRLENILANVADGINIIDSGFRITYQNPDSMAKLGNHVGEFCYKGFHDGRDGVCEGCPVAMAFEDGKVHMKEDTVQAGDGVEHVEIRTAPIRELDGGITGAIESIRDITDRKNMEDEVRKLNEGLETMVRERTRQLEEAQDELLRKERLATLGKLAGVVGHELRNPLGVMNNAVYYLKMVLTDDDETSREYLDIIKDEIAGAERIVSDLLDSVRTKPPRPEPTSMNVLLSTCLENCEITGNVKLSTEIPGGLPALMVDPLQMKQVFINLVNNAVEAMPEGGLLNIRAERGDDGRFVRVSIRDTGAGVSEEDMERLFQPLFTTKARGIGLGLTVVKNLTEANGGAVEVESMPGSGTTFTLTLPIEEEAS